MKDDIALLDEEFQRDAKCREEVERIRPAFELAERMIRLRVQAGLTQERLAQRAGMMQSEIARLESGRFSPTWLTLSRILDAVGATVEVRMMSADGAETTIDLPLIGAGQRQPRKAAS